MRKLFFLIAFLIFGFIVFPSFLSNVSAQRYAECDVCGYCLNKEVPSNWASCAECVYPHVVSPTDGKISNDQAQINSTLLIETDSSKKNFNRPPEPASGRMYTQLGCFGGNLTSLGDPEAGGELVNFILSNLIFPVVGTVGFITIIYGGFVLATAQGDVNKIQQGKMIIAGSLVGLIFTFSVVLMVNIIGSDVLKIPGINQ